MNRFRFAPVLLLATGAAFAQMQAPAPSGASSSQTMPTPPVAVKSFDLTAIDKTADPCSDFYQYACGNWAKNNPIPSDQSRWGRSFSLLRERNIYLLWQELNSAAQSPKSPIETQYGNYFAACMNTDLVEKKGLQPLQPVMDRIAALHDTHGLAALVADLAAQGSATALFDFGIEQDEMDSSKQIAGIGQSGLSLPDRDYYLKQDAHFAEIRKQYSEHLTKMFTLAGDTQRRQPKRPRP